MNARLKLEKLETIFDHNVTESELEALLGEPETLEDYLYALSQDSAYAHLYFLYDLREDKQTSMSFLNKIQDVSFRNQFKMRPCCAVHS